MTEDEMIDWIDMASYEDMLRKWRYATIGDPFFFGTVGEYYVSMMVNKRNALSNRQQVTHSKRVGWK